MPHMMAPLHVLPWEQEHVTHTWLKLHFYTHKPSFQSCSQSTKNFSANQQSSLTLSAEFEVNSKINNISDRLPNLRDSDVGLIKGSIRLSTRWRHAGRRLITEVEAEIGTSGGRRLETARFGRRVWTLHRVNWKLLWKLWKTDPPAWIMDLTARLTRAAPISLLSPSTSSSVSTLLRVFFSSGLWSLAMRENN